jgi:type IV pilus assembly protein PilQ
MNSIYAVIHACFALPMGILSKIKSAMRWGLTGLLMGVLFTTTHAAAEDGKAMAANALENASVTALPGNLVQLKLTLSSTPEMPLSFNIENPARIVFDFPNTANKTAKKSQLIGIGMAKSMNFIESDGRTRVVLNLVKPMAYETHINNNQFYVTLTERGVDAAATATARGANGGKAATTRNINKIDFNRGPKGEGRIVVTMSDPTAAVDVRKEGGKLIVDFTDTKLPASLTQRLDVVDFATSVQNIETFTQGRNVRMVISANGSYDHLAYQSDTRFTVEVKGLTKEEQEASERAQPTYKGERLSLNFQNIEIRAVLQIIADFTGLNMVTSDAVTGNLTLRLKNVPWDQALDIVLKTKGLSKRQVGNVILVGPSEEIAAREKQELESKKQIVDLEPLHTELIQVNYAKAADLAEILKSKENSLLTKERGSVTVDERTNTLLIQDVAERLVEIRKLMVKLDIPIRQVLIESRIVIANDNFSKELGVRFGGTAVRRNGNNGLVTTSGGLASTDTSTNSALSNLRSTGSPFPVTLGTLSDRLNVNLPVVSPAGRIGLSILGSDYLIDLELSAMQAEGRGEIVSSPRVITADRKEATIKQGTQIGFVRPGGVGAVSTIEFKDALLGLKVTPQITPDNHIIMDLVVTKDSVGELFNNIPSIDKKEVSTQVLVNNGETVVLGGVYETVRSRQVDGVPILSELPWIGALFRKTSNTDDKVELLIFVTPKILHDGVALK